MGQQTELMQASISVNMSQAISGLPSTKIDSLPVQNYQLMGFLDGPSFLWWLIHLI